MNKVLRTVIGLSLVILGVVLMVSAVRAEGVTPTAQIDPCYEGKVITVELSQSHFSLDLGTHLKDAMNKVKFRMPVSCSFYEKIKVGDNLLTKSGEDSFRWGSFIVEGSVGNWKLTVVAK